MSYNVVVIYISAFSLTTNIYLVLNCNNGQYLHFIFITNILKSKDTNWIFILDGSVKTVPWQRKYFLKSQIIFDNLNIFLAKTFSPVFNYTSLWCLLKGWTNFLYWLMKLISKHSQSFLNIPFLWNETKMKYISVLDLSISLSDRHGRERNNSNTKYLFQIQEICTLTHISDLTPALLLLQYFHRVNRENGVNFNN